MSTGSYVFCIGRSLCASKEENDNLPAYVKYNPKRPFLLPPFFESRDSI
jgi:hypothetical protein